MNQRKGAKALYLVSLSFHLTQSVEIKMLNHVFLTCLFLIGEFSFCFTKPESRYAFFDSDYMTFGGFDVDGKSTDSVHLVDAYAQTTCLHSTLPVAMKESHVFEYNDTLLLCSTFTKEDKNNLQCFIWDPLAGWKNFPTPENNGIFDFISAVRMPGVGIWFITTQGTPTGSNTLLLDENTGNWTSAFQWTIHRSRGCAVQINYNTVANIGGLPKPASLTEGMQIDTYNFETNIELRGVAKMAYNRKMHGCALLPNGPSGNPTVAISK